ncbi:MAG: hypothetical protein ACRED5_09935 [Propylenella sp.]
MALSRELGAVTHTATTGFAPMGEVLWTAFPDGSSVGSAGTPWTYDIAGRLYSVPGVVTSATYEADGQTDVISYPNFVQVTFAYDPERRWLDSMETGRTLLDPLPIFEILQRLDYQHDAAGRITSVASTRAKESWTYTHDTLDRLTFADNLSDNTLDQTFSYALNGNMLTNNPVVGTYTYGPATGPRPHAQINAGTRSYDYDDNGNALSNGTQTYTWDGENRLLSVTASGATTSFVYAPDGTWLKKLAAAGATLYLGPDIERDPAGVWTKYPHPDAVIVGSGGSAATTWLTRDHSQSIRLRTDATGALSQASAYRPYGVAFSAPPPPALTLAKGYIGERRDPGSQ